MKRPIDNSLSPVLALLLILPPLTGLALEGAESLVPAEKFFNPIAEGADPWVVRDRENDRYLWCMSDGNRGLAIQTSDRLTSTGQKHVVWKAPSSGPYSREIWAPELHRLDGFWYIYFAASDGRNENHLAYVLKSRTADPLGPYDLHGPLATGDGADRRSPNIWAIDMTVLEHRSRWYAIWSGWDAPGTDQQFLYIAAMKSPTELTGPRIRLCNNSDYAWEITEPNDTGRGLNEGPQVFQSGAATCVIYSCGASWLPTYKLGMLELVGNDPLDPASWVKRSKPVFQGTDEIYGVGHSCFVKSPDGKEWWHIYHAKRDRAPGWHREIRVQPMSVDEDGFPVFGQPLGNKKILDRPSGETTTSATLPAKLFGAGCGSNDYSFYGHHQFMEVSDRGIEFGRIPTAPINDYRCGEKIVFNPLVPSDMKAEVTIDFRGNHDARDAGILFRCSGASIGYDSQQAYFAGLIPKTSLIILGKTDGTNWTELARSSATLNTAEPQTLAVQMIGNQITVSQNGQQRLRHSDDTYASGSVGLRVVDTHAVFTDLIITPTGK